MKTLTTILFLFIINISFAQHENILITNTDSPNEPAILVNPYNTDIILASVNTDKTYYSSDAGYSWTKVDPTSTYGVWGDPCLISVWTEIDNNLYIK